MASGVALLALGWVGDVLPAIWAALVAAAEVSWALLSITLPVPLWALMAGSCGIAGSTRYFLSRPRAQSPIDGGVKAVEPVLISYSELEIAIVRLLAENYGEWFHINEIATSLRTGPLLVEKSLQNLSERLLINDRHSSTRGTSFQLSAQGRDLAIEKASPVVHHTLPNTSLQPTAQMLRIWVPYALRAPASSEFNRWAACCVMRNVIHSEHDQVVPTQGLAQAV